MADTPVMEDLWGQYFISLETGGDQPVKSNICRRPRLPDWPCRCSHQADRYLCVCSLCVLL